MSSVITRKKRIALQTHFVFVVSAILFSDRSSAHDFPLESRGRSAAQVVALAERAAGEKLIVVDMKVRVLRNRILFDVEFGPIPNDAAWMIMVNIDANRLRAANRDHEAAGYSQAILQSVRANRKTLYSVVWVRETPATEPLKLPDGPSPVTGDAHAALQPVDELMTAFLRDHNVAGATLAIADGHQLVYSRGFGYSDVESKQPMPPDAEMRIASVSKSITATAILMLVQDGKLSLDAHVLSILETDKFPKLSPSADQRWKEITLRQLLQHTGGFDSDASGDPMFQVSEITRAQELKRLARPRDIVKHQLKQPLDFDPGDHYAYSNFGYCLLGRIVEAVSEQSYEEFVRQRILTPCGMARTRLGKTRLEDRGKQEARYHMQTKSMHTPVWSGAPSAGRRASSKPTAEVAEPYGRWDLEVMDSHGGWVSNAPDLVRLAASLDGKPGPLLTQKSLQQMIARPKYTTPSFPGFRYGLGWMVRPVSIQKEDALAGCEIWHNGALAGLSALLVRRDDGVAWAVLFNTDVSTNGERLSELIDPLLHRTLRDIAFAPPSDL